MPIEGPSVGSGSIILAGHPGFTTPLASSNNNAALGPDYNPTAGSIGTPPHGVILTLPAFTVSVPTTGLLFDFAVRDAITSAPVPFMLAITGSAQATGLQPGVTVTLTVKGDVQDVTGGAMEVPGTAVTFTAALTSSTTTYMNTSGNISLPGTANKFVFEDIQFQINNNTGAPVDNVSIDPVFTITTDAAVAAPAPPGVVLAGIGLALLPLGWWRRGKAVGAE
jgi:hypothetical protein